MDCLKRPLLYPQYSRCSDKPGPEKDHCLIYRKNRFSSDGPCEKCSEGYGMQMEGNLCIPIEGGKIKNCLTQNKWLNSWYCSECDGGIFNVETNDCMSLDLLPEGYKLDNCLVGGGVFKPNKPSRKDMKCSKCKEGYVNKFGEGCVKSDIQGCVDLSNGYCLCDYENGWLAASDLICYKDEEFKRKIMILGV